MKTVTVSATVEFEVEVHDEDNDIDFKEEWAEYAYGWLADGNMPSKVTVTEDNKTNNVGKRYQFIVDHFPDFSYLNKPGEYPRPTVDIDDLVSFIVHLEELCKECGHWRTVDTLGGVDYDYGMYPNVDAWMPAPDGGVYSYDEMKDDNLKDQLDV